MFHELDRLPTLISTLKYARISTKNESHLVVTYDIHFIINLRDIKYVSKDRGIRFEQLAKTLQDTDYDLVGLQEVTQQEKFVS